MGWPEIIAIYASSALLWSIPIRDQMLRADQAAPALPPLWVRRGALVLASLLWPLILVWIFVIGIRHRR